ncbi:MAG: hypothetical protein J5379_04425 [Clostridiales bacterium]|nr:hypothetical protein [Clostridiales bacterium]
MDRLKAFTIFFAIVCLAVCLWGCAEKDKDFTGEVEDSPLSEQEIISCVKDYMMTNFQDEVDVKILRVSKLTYTTYVAPGIDGPGIFGNKYVEVKDGHCYSFKITNQKYGITAEGTYTDGFTLQNIQTGATETIDREILIDERYQTMKDEVDVVKDFESILSQNVSKFHFYKDVTNHNHEIGYYNIYIYSAKYEDLEEVLQKLVEISSTKYSRCVYAFRAFVFTDESFYDSFDFDVCNNVNFVDPGRGENEEDHPEKMTISELKYEPEKLIAHYLKCEVTRIDSDEDFDYTFYIFTGDPQMYKNSLEKTSKEIRYGMTEEFGIVYSR